MTASSASTRSTPTPSRIRPMYRISRAPDCRSGSSIADTIHERDRQPELDALQWALSACESLRRDADDLENLPSCLDRPAGH